MTSHSIEPASVRLKDITRVSELNPRKTEDVPADDELVASIRSEGLISPPLVRRIPGSLQFFEVLAGGRRWRALAQIRNGDDMVPVLEFRHKEPESDDATREAAALALAENVVRQPMHPVDEVEAFARLAAEGWAEDQIASAFGVSARTVRQRLALGNLVPEARQRWRNGEMEMEHARALAAAGTARQEEILTDKRIWRSPPAIRAAVRENMIDGTGDIALLAGADAYVAAGGTIEADLFTEKEWWSDGALARRVALEKLQAEAEARMDREGWGFARATLGAWPDDLDEADVDPEHLPEEAQELRALRYGDPTLAAFLREDEIEAAAYMRAIPSSQRANMGVLVQFTGFEASLFTVSRAIVPEIAADEEDAGDAAATGPQEREFSAASPAPQGEAPPAQDRNTVKLAREIARVQQKALAEAVRSNVGAALGLVLAYPQHLIYLQPGNFNASTHLAEMFATAVVHERLSIAAVTPLEDLTTGFCAAVATTVDVSPLHGRDLVAALRMAAGHGAAIEAHLREAFDPHEYFSLCAKEACAAAIGQVAGEDAASRAAKASRTRAAEMAATAIANWSEPWLPPEIRAALEPAPAADERSTAQAMADAIAADEEGQGDDEGEEDGDQVEGDARTPLQQAIAKFMHDCTRQADGEVKALDLYNHFIATLPSHFFCAAAIPISLFGKHMRDLGYASRRKANGVHYTGIEMAFDKRDDDEAEDAA